MIRFDSATTIRVREEKDALVGDRTELVRRPQGADATLFGGWGVKI
jgi:hypothetical protein